MHMMSPDGTSHSFDESANGYGRGEGIGAVLLKPVSAALADGDHIRAIIRGTGINQDGRTPGITLPSPTSQANLIRSTYERHGLSMRDTAYFEAHGTGTPVGVSQIVQAITTFSTVLNYMRLGPHRIIRSWTDFGPSPNTN
jgi:acyl transferase domain-containing protein